MLSTLEIKEISSSRFKSICKQTCPITGPVSHPIVKDCLHPAEKENWARKCSATAPILISTKYLTVKNRGKLLKRKMSFVQNILYIYQYF